ncbi:hypothetical protein [Enterovirga aerilata]|uniref:Uncharacterized protein n=1 Tax=Enterovirga aerilata TaxID=2730920 RepID=A0A849I455_9HYPH|nr:hypothetical protein [Enterovirga sp. DB1703]NNM74212.1 hypothetical protein [Enterovirga sp. DB1703]
MREAAEVIRSSEKGALGEAEILARLSPETLRRARDYGPLDAALLRRKMMIRVKHERYFEVRADGRFALLQKAKRKR